LGAANQTGPVVPAVNGLTAAISHLTLDTSPESVREVEDWLGDLAGQAPPSDNADAVKALLVHGRMLHDLLPATDYLLKAIRPVRRTPAQADLRAIVVARQSASRTTARAFRLLLYVASLLLVAVLAYVGLQLLARTLALQRHAHSSMCSLASRLASSTLGRTRSGKMFSKRSPNCPSGSVRTAPISCLGPRPNCMSEKCQDREADPSSRKTMPA
jgi:hypothetical protein